MNHGYGPYTRGCRCDVCREAKRVYQAQRRASGAEPTRAGEQPLPAWNQRTYNGVSRVGVARVRLSDVTHGTTTGYRRGCRCWDCTDAASTRSRRRVISPQT